MAMMVLMRMLGRGVMRWGWEETDVQPTSITTAILLRGEVYSLREALFK